MKVNPGLSAYAGDPEGAGGSVEELVEFGKGRVPRELWGETERGLALVVSTLFFSIGSDEGLYAWVIANYALGTLGGDPLETTGIIELGGASAQVAFVSTEPVPPEFSRTVEFGNITYNIYSHSFLNLGQNAAFEALRESVVSGNHHPAAESLGKGIFVDPCTPKGYSRVVESLKLSPGSLTEKNRFVSTLHSRGNFSECRSAALTLLQKGKAGEHLCGEDWSTLKKKHHSFKDEDLVHYCFSSAYIVALLHDSLGIGVDDPRIEFANQVGNIPLDWALGAFILHTNVALDMEHSDWIATIISDDSPTLLSLIGFAILIMFIAWSISKWRKPQLKTVYDLEKGRWKLV
ncbi:hypothetical protein D5086_016143 [Populus alba]|uniref:Uncharacterized protein n=1 Tax=Populus alba TaxID=43335 RepID=A0ACC4BUZ0_POPAL